MEQDFYKGFRLVEKFGHRGYPVPNKRWSNYCPRHSFYNELFAQGLILPQSKASYLNIIEKPLMAQGVQAVILGCTEIALLVSKTTQKFLYPTRSDIHAHAWCLNWRFLIVRHHFWKHGGYAEMSCFICLAILVRLCHTRLLFLGFFKNGVDITQFFMKPLRILLVFLQAGCD